jgi:predicted nucleic acid-binding protein
VRVVLDTNIYVSAFVLPGSAADRAMQRIFDGHDTLLISKPILDELLTILGGALNCVLCLAGIE